MAKRGATTIACWVLLWETEGHGHLEWKPFLMGKTETFWLFMTAGWWWWWGLPSVCSDSLEGVRSWLRAQYHVPVLIYTWWAATSAPAPTTIPGPCLCLWTWGQRDLGDSVVIWSHISVTEWHVFNVDLPVFPTNDASVQGWKKG